MIFEWDAGKDAANRQKHHVSFDVAKNVFSDPSRIEWRDDNHSNEEERYITIGRAGKILVVIYTERAHGDTIRLISARRANKDERSEYYAGQGSF